MNLIQGMVYEVLFEMGAISVSYEKCRLKRFQTAFCLDGGLFCGLFAFFCKIFGVDFVVFAAFTYFFQRIVHYF